MSPLSIIGAAAVAAAGAVIAKNVAGDLDRDDLDEFIHDTAVLPGGRRANYRIQGRDDGQTVLLIHGGGDSLSTWDAWVTELGDHYRLVSVDLPGHGMTDPDPAGEYGRWLFASFIADFVDALDLQDFVLVGHSYGAESSLQFMVENPGKAIGLVLIAGAGYVTPFPTSERVLAGLARTPLVHALRYVSSAPLTRALLEPYYLDVSTLSDDDIRSLTKLMRYGPNRMTPWRMTEFQARSYRDITGLDTVDVPTLVLFADKDAVVPVEHAHRLEREIADTELHIFVDAGHCLHHEYPADSAAKVHDFLQRRIASGQPT